MGRLVDRGPNDGARLERAATARGARARSRRTDDDYARSRSARALLSPPGALRGHVRRVGRVAFRAGRHVARFDSNRKAWLPLRGGRLGSADDASVNALAFCDDQLLILGRFGTLAGKALESPNVAVYEPDAGLAPDAAGGFVFASGAPAAVARVAVDQAAGVAYVAGRYDAIVPRGLPCAGVAAKPFREGGARGGVADPAFAFEPGSANCSTPARVSSRPAPPRSAVRGPPSRRGASPSPSSPRRRVRAGGCAGAAATPRWDPKSSPRRPGSGSPGGGAWTARRAHFAAVAGDAGAFQLVVAGAFDDAPPVAVWTEDARLGPYQSQGGQALRGVATAGAAVGRGARRRLPRRRKPKPRDDVDAGLAGRRGIADRPVARGHKLAALLVALAAALIRRCWPARKPRLNNLRDGISPRDADGRHAQPVRRGVRRRGVTAAMARHLRDAHAFSCSSTRPKSY